MVDSGFVKDGKASPFVAHQYSGTPGKTGNCQIGVSVQMATDSDVAGGELAAVLPAILG